ncbi:hypothetical protein [Bacillus sp. FJAT-27251]|uniref:hypothetical protein n=1 Tax=Bacillus sp. FJAT-27251 TaxID=1684142 RepID=UPI0006A7A004|nr:hypothetical protein [Bacillus sp. FJAT-27251]
MIDATMNVGVLERPVEGELVMIKAIPPEAITKMEPEDFFYLKGFENKKGTITEVIENHTGIFSYRVDFNESLFGYFYEGDFCCISNGN